MLKGEHFVTAARQSALFALDRGYTQFLLDLRNWIGEVECEAGPFVPAMGQLSSMLRANMGAINGLPRTVRGFCAGISEHGGDASDNVLSFERAFAAALSKLIDEAVKPLSKKLRSEPRAEARIKEAARAVRDIESQLSEVHHELQGLVESEFHPTYWDPVSRAGDARKLTVASVDMSQYGRHAITLTDLVRAEGVKALNCRIRDTLLDAMAEAEIDPSGVPLISTGDGALLFFGAAADAWSFSRVLHETVFSEQLADPKNRVYFRVGLSTGRVIAEPYMSGGRWMGTQAAGLPIIDAVRLESKCRTGSILICNATYGELGSPAEFEAITVTKKSHEGEPMTAWWTRVVEPAPWDLA